MSCLLDLRATGPNSPAAVGGGTRLSGPPYRKESFGLTPWQRWPDSNQRIRESKSRALPLGDTAIRRTAGGVVAPRFDEARSELSPNTARFLHFGDVTEMAGGFHGFLFCAPREHEHAGFPAGAADRNRTGTTSLEGWGSAVKLQRHGALPESHRGCALAQSRFLRARLVGRKRGIFGGMRPPGAASRG